MLTWILRRVLAVVPVLFGVTLAVFSMLFLVPGDPVKMMLAEFVTNPDQVAQMRAQLHLDEPILQQYGRFVANAARGDLGTSIRSRRPVTTEIGENVASTAQLAVAAMLVAVAVGVPLGLLAALSRNSWLDVASMGTALLGVSMPSFWLGLLLIFAFSLHLAWFPATGGGDLRHLVLPSITLGTIAAAIIARLTRSSMLEVLGQDYVRTARAKGLTEKTILLKHVLRNAMIPILTNVAVALPGIFVGSFLIEVFFSIPGLGRELLLAVNRSDYPVIQAFAIYLAVITMVVNLTTDVLYTLVDPRVVLK